MKIKVLQKFDRLLTIKRYSSLHLDKWVCKCDCGEYIFVNSYLLLHNVVQSCGCVSNNRFKHGQSKYPEYRVYDGMKQRCTNTKNEYYYRYGGRGITVCDRWLYSFPNFLEDMGPRPSSKHSLERINNDGNYEPGNCKWATRIEQANNTSTNRFIKDLDGNMVTIAQLAKANNINRNTLVKRIDKDGLTIEEAIRKPVGIERIYSYNGFNLSLAGWSKKTGIRKHTLWMRLNRTKWSFGKAINTPTTDRQYTHNGMTLTLANWAVKTGIPRNTLWGRIIQNGWSMERALTTRV